VQTYDVVLDAVGEATRRSILAELRAGPATVGAIAERLPVSRPAVSQHLKVLHGAGLVTFEPRGTRNVYRLDPSGFDELRAWLDDLWSTVLDHYVKHATDIATKEAP
jgi:DNA-binding transcriptional ArsR family regulator